MRRGYATFLDEHSRLLIEGQTWESGDGYRERTIITPCCRPNGDDKIIAHGPLDHIEVVEVVTTRSIISHQTWWNWVNRNKATRKGMN